jgi:hypothetical protein
VIDIEEKLASLKARSAYPGCPAMKSIKELERIFDIGFPQAYRTLLTSYPGGIFFDATVLSRFPKSGPLGDQFDVNMFYGVCGGDYDILKINEMFSESLGGSKIAIAESSGGNQICIEKNTGAIFFFHHEAVNYEAEYMSVSDDFTSFMTGLYLGNDDIGSLDGIIEGESFLDF